MVYNSEQSSVNFLSENEKDSKNSAMLTKKPNMRKIFCAFLLSIYVECNFSQIKKTVSEIAFFTVF